MIKRKAMAALQAWKNDKTQEGLLVTGARQVGKTTLIRLFAEQNYDVFVEINFFERPDAVDLIREAKSTQDLMLRISALSDTELASGNTLIFFDEIQEFEDILTWVKFLEERTAFDYVFSGSLLGIDAFDIRSWPVGFLQTIELYPLDFEEFCMATNVANLLLDDARAAFEQSKPTDDAGHTKLMEAYRNYLMIGGMPHAVQRFLDTNDLQLVRRIQGNIVALYQHDIAQYMDSKAHARFVKTLYDAIPSQLNKENKRYRFKGILPQSAARFSYLESSFDWLEHAGVALPVFRISEPCYPLALHETRSVFKLYMNDIGLLTSRLMGGVDIEILKGQTAINYGSLYENAVAQELTARGFLLHYYNSTKRGEVDFVIENATKGAVTLLEIKSGKDYKRHVALSNLLQVKEYAFEQAYVFCNENVHQRGNITYLPVYMTAFL
jgi:predicted AAA+ superfamily ATPase